MQASSKQIRLLKLFYSRNFKGKIYYKRAGPDNSKFTPRKFSPEKCSKALLLSHKQESVDLLVVLE